MTSPMPRETAPSEVIDLGEITLSSGRRIQFQHRAHANHDAFVLLSINPAREPGGSDRTFHLIIPGWFLPELREAISKFEDSVRTRNAAKPKRSPR
jgi:hypothetical protein